MQLLSEVQHLHVGRNDTVWNLLCVWSESLSDVNKSSTVQWPGNQSIPAREPSLSPDVPQSKQSEGGGVWGAQREREREAVVLLSSFYFNFFSILFFNPSDEVCTGRSMFSQTAILLHHMCLTHGMVGRRGVCREQEKGEAKKMKSRMGSSQQNPFLTINSFIKSHRMKNVTTVTQSCPEVSPFNAGRQMSQVLTEESQVSTQNGGRLRADWPLPSLRMWCRRSDHVIRGDGK